LNHRLINTFVLFIAATYTAISTPLLAARPSTAFADSLAKSGVDPLVVADGYSACWQHDKALAGLQASGRNDAETLWRQARSRIDLGENLAGEEALRQFERAEKLARRAVELAPENADAQQTLAIVLGRVALFKGIFSSVGLVKEIYPAALKAIALNDSMPRSMYIVGRLHQELTVKPGFALKLLGLGWASKDSIGYYYEKALKLNPGLIQTRVAYAEYLLEQPAGREIAKKLLEEAISLPVIDEQDVKAKEEAKVLKGKAK
jgi:tetratricopeptide (TPR) repeat protein